MFRKDPASGTADAGQDGVRLGSRRNSPCRNVEPRAQQGWWDEGVCAAGQQKLVPGLRPSDLLIRGVRGGLGDNSAVSGLAEQLRGDVT